MSYKVDLLNKSTLAKIKVIELVNEPEIYEEINGSFTLEFDAHYTAKNDLNDNVIVLVDGKYFKITKVTKSRTDTITLSVQCEHISYELIVDYELSEDMEFESDAKTMIDGFLEGTRFKLVSCVATDSRYYRTKTLDIRKRLFEVANLFDCELIFDNFNVSLVKDRGADKGLDVELGVNLIGVTEEIDFVDRKTSYELDLVDLSGVSDQGSKFANAEIGDTITIIDGVLGIRSNERIIAIRYNPFKKALPSVVVGEYIPDFVEYVRDDEEEETEEEKELIDYFRQFKIDGVDVLKKAGDANEEVMNYLTNRYVSSVEASSNYNSLKKELTGIVAEKSSDVSGILSVVVTKIGSNGLISTTITEITSPTQLSTLKIDDITSVTLVISKKSLSYYREKPDEVTETDIIAIGLTITFEQNDDVFLDKFNVGKMSVLGIEKGNVTHLIEQLIQDRSSIPVAPAEVEITDRLVGIDVVPKDDYKKWYLTLIHSVKNGSDETWSYGVHELPLKNNSDFKVTAYEKDSVIVVISDEPFSKILDGVASSEAYYQAFGATFVFGEVTEETDFLEEFKIGDVDMLSIATDERYNVINNSGDAASSNFYYTDDALNGLHIRLKPDYSNYHITVFHHVNGDLYVESYNEDMRSWGIGTSDDRGDSIIIAITSIHPNDITSDNIEESTLMALGVNIIIEEGANGAGTYLEYGFAPLADQMTLYFENGPYDDVISITTGITTTQGGLEELVTISVNKVYNDEGQVESLEAYAYYGGSSIRPAATGGISTYDYMESSNYVNFHAIGLKGKDRVVD